MGDGRKRVGVASRESKGQTKSCDDQDRETLEACEERADWDVVGMYRDGVSASRFARQARKNWPRLIADVEAGRLDIVAAWEVSRADRDLERWVPFVSMCRRVGVLIFITSHDMLYDPRKRRHWRALIDEGVNAADESEKISERALKGIRGAVLEGKPHGGPPPYGYTRIYDQYDRTRFTQRPNDDAPIVVEIIKRIAVRDPIIIIERDLNRRGVPPPGWPGVPVPLGQWHRSTIRKIALNPAYLGQRRHNGMAHQGNWPPICDEPDWEDTWRTAQAVLNEEGRKTTAPGSYRWLLSYLAVGQCGGQLHAVSSRGRKFRYVCQEDGCVSVGMWELDEYVTGVVTAWFVRKGARVLFERADVETAAVKVELARLNEELEDARRSWLRPGGISADDFAAKKRVLEPLIVDAQKRIMRASTPGAVLKLLSAAEAGASLARPCWDGLSVAARRSVVAALVKEIRVQPTENRLTRWSSDEERVLVAGWRTAISWLWA